MTLLSDIVRVLHDAEVADYSVHAGTIELPGAPDLVVIVDGAEAGTAAEVLNGARLPISRLRLASAGVIHVWES